MEENMNEPYALKCGRRAELRLRAKNRLDEEFAFCIFAIIGESCGCKYADLIDIFPGYSEDEIIDAINYLGIRKYITINENLVFRSTDIPF